MPDQNSEGRRQNKSFLVYMDSLRYLIKRKTNGLRQHTWAKSTPLNALVFCLVSNTGIADTCKLICLHLVRLSCSKSPGKKWSYSLDPTCLFIKLARFYCTTLSQGHKVLTAGRTSAVCHRGLGHLSHLLLLDRSTRVTHRQMLHGVRNITHGNIVCPCWVPGLPSAVPLCRNWDCSLGWVRAFLKK